MKPEDVEIGQVYRCVECEDCNLRCVVQVTVWTEPQLAIAVRILKVETKTPLASFFAEAGERCSTDPDSLRPMTKTEILEALL